MLPICSQDLVPFPFSREPCMCHLGSSWFPSFSGGMDCRLVASHTHTLNAEFYEMVCVLCHLFHGNTYLHAGRHIYQLIDIHTHTRAENVHTSLRSQLYLVSKLKRSPVACFVTKKRVIVSLLDT